MNDRLAPIGIFDSGVGGLTVARSIIDQLPDEDIVYVGDTAHGPYGPLSIPEVRAHALAIGDDLVRRGAKAIVIACNTASAACLRDARERYDVPVVEVILPAVRRAVPATRTGRLVLPRSYDRALATIVDNAGLPRLTSHGLRHTAATHMVQGARDVGELRAIADLLGHSPEMLMYTYAHVLPQSQTAVVDRISRRTT